MEKVSRLAARIPTGGTQKVHDEVALAAVAIIKNKYKTVLMEIVPYCMLVLHMPSIPIPSCSISLTCPFIVFSEERKKKLKWLLSAA